MSLHTIRPTVRPSVHDSTRVDIAAGLFEEAAIQQVALGGWRVTDRLVDPLDQRHLLGYIEARGEQYETMHIGIEFSWTMFDTLSEAVHHLLTEGRIAAVARGSGDMSWLAALPKSSLDEL